MKKFQFRINGKIYDVELLSTEGASQNTISQPIATTSPQVAAPAAQAAAEPAKAPETTTNAPAVSGKATGYVLSPLPGILRSYNVKPGDRVKEGDTVLVLEAMKMENNIFAERDGVVLELLGQIGAAILEGDKLIALGD